MSNLIELAKRLVDDPKMQVTNTIVTKLIERIAELKAENGVLRLHLAELEKELAPYRASSKIDKLLGIDKEQE